MFLDLRVHATSLRLLSPRKFASSNLAEGYTGQEPVSGRQFGDLGMPEQVWWVVCIVPCHTAVRDVWGEDTMDQPTGLGVRGQEA